MINEASLEIPCRISFITSTVLVAMCCSPRVFLRILRVISERTGATIAATRTGNNGEVDKNVFIVTAIAAIIIEPFELANAFLNALLFSSSVFAPFGPSLSITFFTRGSAYACCITFSPNDNEQAPPSPISISGLEIPALTE